MPPEVRARIATWLRVLAKHYDSQAEFAKALGYDQSYVSRLLSEARDPSIAFLLELSRVKGVSVQDLLFGRPPREVDPPQGSRTSQRPAPSHGGHQNR